MINPIDPIKIIIHKERIQQVIAGEIPPPITVGLDISNLCNNACVWCLYDDYKKKCNINMSKKNIYKALYDMYESNVLGICLSGGGEPTMNPYINETILTCKKLKLEVSLNTNGCRLNKLTEKTIRALSYIRISLDAGSIKTHNLLHRPSENNFDQILYDIKKICDKKLTKIGVGYLVHPANHLEIHKIIQILDKIGVDYIQIRPLKNVYLSLRQKEVAFLQIGKAKLHTSITVYESFSKMDDTIKKKLTVPKCYINRLVSNIGPDGSVYTCCELRGIQPIGNIKNNHFNNIWLSDKHKEILENLDISKCPACKYAKGNEIIERVFVNDELDRNFI